MTAADRVWNRAAEAWDPNARAGFRAGDVALADLLAFHSVAMNGGIIHALHVVGDQLQGAVEGYRYFGFDRVAALLERAYVPTKGVENMRPSEAEALEGELDRMYTEHIPSDQTLVGAFETHFAARPDEYDL